MAQALQAYPDLIGEALFAQVARDDAEYQVAVDAYLVDDEANCTCDLPCRGQQVRAQHLVRAWPMRKLTVVARCHLGLRSVAAWELMFCQ